MATRISRTIGLAAIASVLAYGQTGKVAGPSAGLVFDATARALRPVKGIPGSATIGDAVQLNFDMASAYLSPHQEVALAIGADNSVHYLRIQSGEVSERALDGLAIQPERVVFSPRGSSALLIAGSRGAILTGMPDNPAVGASLDLENPGDSLSISDDAAYLLAAGHGSVRLLGVGTGENLKLMDTTEAVIAAFAPGGYDAAVADDGAGLMLFRNAVKGGEPNVLAAPDDGITSPVGLSFSADGRKLFVASRAARSVFSFDLQAGERAAIACTCTPAGLMRMGGVFRLNDLGSEPLWLLDPGASEARIVFVPALRTE